MVSKWQGGHFGDGGWRIDVQLRVDGSGGFCRHDVIVKVVKIERGLGEHGTLAWVILLLHGNGIGGIESGGTKVWLVLEEAVMILFIVADMVDRGQRQRLVTTDRSTGESKSISPVFTHSVSTCLPAEVLRIQRTRS